MTSAVAPLTNEVCVWCACVICDILSYQRVRVSIVKDTAFIGACGIVLSSEEFTPIPSTFIGAYHMVLFCETLCFLCRALETRKPNDPYTLYERPLYPFEKSPRNTDRCT